MTDTPLPSAPPHRRPFHAALLAGGASSRMGQPKADLVWKGRTLLEHALGALTLVTDHVVVLGRARGIPRPAIGIVDALPGQGPALAVARYALAADTPVLVLAVDTPLADHSALTWLRDTWRAGAPTHSVVATDAERTHPTFALYTPETIRAAFGKHAAAQNAPLRELAAKAHPRTPPNPAWLTNVNTPADWSTLPT